MNFYFCKNQLDSSCQAWFLEIVTCPCIFCYKWCCQFHQHYTQKLSEKFLILHSRFDFSYLFSILSQKVFRTKNARDKAKKNLFLFGTFFMSRHFSCFWSIPGRTGRNALCQAGPLVAFEIFIAIKTFYKFSFTVVPAWSSRLVDVRLSRLVDVRSSRLVGG